MKTVVLIIFTFAYAGLLLLPRRKTIIGAAAAALVLLIGALPLRRLPAAIDWNVLLMILGTGGVVMMVVESRATELLAEMLLERTPNVKWAAVALCGLAGLLSAFLENVSTLLIMAPVALAVAVRAKTSPVPLMIVMALSSNLQGAATLVGDPTAIMMGGYAGLNFTDFFVFKGRPGMFFAVELGAFASLVCVAFIFRKETEPLNIRNRTTVTSLFPSLLLAGMITALIAASFLPAKPAMTNGLICAAALAIGLLRETRHDGRIAGRIAKKTDWHTITLLASLFVLIAAVVNVGLLHDIAAALAGIGRKNVFLLYSALLWGSVLASAFVDNIPYIAVMLPVVQATAEELGIPPYLFYFGLLSGATLGGNMTPIGASTNIAAMGILKKHGYEVKLREFASIGVPFTLCAVAAAYVFLWLVWGSNLTPAPPP